MPSVGQALICSNAALLARFARKPHHFSAGATLTAPQRRFFLALRSKTATLLRWGCQAVLPYAFGVT